MATIQEAINAAAVGDTVLLAPGTYTGSGNKDLSFGGKDIALIGAAGSAATIIDCESAGRGILLIGGESSAAQIQGITIRNGNRPMDKGGGVRCVGSSPTLLDVTVQSCAAKYTGGLSFTDGALPLIQDCLIEGNESTYEAGGLTLGDGCDAVLRNVVVRQNHCLDRGGGVMISYANPKFHNVTFEGNEAASQGGGVSGNWGSQPTFVNCIFLGNHARSGGGLDISCPLARVEECVFRGNWASELGGAIYLVDSDSAVFRNCLIDGNTAGAGGAVYVGEFSALPPTQFINTTMVGNQCWWAAGSAITANWQAEVELVNCLVVGNFGGAALWTDHAAAIAVSCSDIWGNPDGNYGGDMLDLSGVDGNISQDPLFCDAEGDDYTLEDSSPCLPGNNGCSVQMGAFGLGCNLTAIGAPAPAGVALEANYPNPFNPSTTIPFCLGVPTTVTLTIHDVSGRLVRVLADLRSFPTGKHELHWNGFDAAGHPAPSGVYLYRLETPQGATARPMLLVK